MHTKALRSAYFWKDSSSKCVTERYCVQSISCGTLSGYDFNQIFTSKGTIATKFSDEIENLSEIHKLLLMGDSVKILEIETKLKNDYPYLSISKSSPHYLEVMANGIHKGEAVSFLAAYYGVNIKDTIAFGDNFNDLDMLLTVGQGFVMANGPEIVQQRVGQTTTDNNHDGIAHVLNRYFNGDEPFKVD